MPPAPHSNALHLSSTADLPSTPGQLLMMFWVR